MEPNDDEPTPIPRKRRTASLTPPAAPVEFWDDEWEVIARPRRRILPDGTHDRTWVIVRRRLPGGPDAGKILITAGNVGGRRSRHARRGGELLPAGATSDEIAAAITRCCGYALVSEAQRNACISELPPSSI